MSRFGKLLNISTLTFGAFSPFISSLSMLTHGSFISSFLVTQEIIVTPSGRPKTASVAIRRELWTPKSNVVPLLFAVWNQKNIEKFYQFEIWTRKYDYVDTLYHILEEKYRRVPLEFKFYDIYILEDKISEIDIVDLGNDREIFENKDLGWMVIDDK